MSGDYGPTPGSGINYPARAWVDAQINNGGYANGGYVSYPYIAPLPYVNYPTITYPQPLVTAPPFAPTDIGGLLGFIPTGGATKLTPPQMNQLLSGHKFIPMDGSDFCLFCYALDVFRRQLDHLFVISEE